LPNGYCKHCRKNAQAERPFSKMKKLSLSMKVLEQVAKQYDIDPGCVICLSIENFSKLQQFERLKERA
jgi:hypothetical protein